MARSLIEALDAAVQEPSRGFTFLDDALEPRRWSFAAISREATRRAQLLRQRGLQPGDRVGLIIPEGEDFVLNFFAAVRAGLVPVPMYPPLALAKLDRYLDTAERILRAAGARAVLASRPVARLLGTLLRRVPSLEQLELVEPLRRRHPAAERIDLSDVRPTPESLCFLQFTSGSTATPKGVAVTHANLAANAAAIMRDGLDCDPTRDLGVSWLPLYHDMGLIGFVIAPLFYSVPVVFIPTLRFVKGPSVWMDTISRYRGTISFAPNFAFSLATRRASPAKLAQLDLSCLRVLGCGAEPINPAVMRRFTDRFRPAGLRPEAVTPAYGMAEATLAVSFEGLERAPSSLRIDRERYERDRRAVPSAAEAATEAMELVSVGRPSADHQLAIRREDGGEAIEGEVGEIHFRGPSVTAGYFDDPAATAARFTEDGWLRTGDLGFVHRGQLYISGRAKDLIILNGRNYDPQTIEWEAEQVQGVRAGQVVAFSTEGVETEALVIVAEHAARCPELAPLAEQLRARVSAETGAAVHEVLLLPPGSLPKTSSGKPQRQQTKALYLAGALADHRRRDLRASRAGLTRQLSLSAMAQLQHSLRHPKKTAKRALADARRATLG